MPQPEAEQAAHGTYAQIEQLEAEIARLKNIVQFARMAVSAWHCHEGRAGITMPLGSVMLSLEGALESLRS